VMARRENDYGGLRKRPGATEAASGERETSEGREGATTMAANGGRQRRRR